MEKCEMAADMDGNEKFYRFVNRVIRALLAGVVFFSLLQSLFATGFVGRLCLEDGSRQERTLNIADNPLRHLFLFVFLTVALFLARELWQAAKARGFHGLTARNVRRVFWCLTIFTFLAAAGYVLLTRLAPGSDPAKVYEIAMQWRRGDFSAFEEDAYLFRYPFQAGIVFFFYLLSFPFGMGNYVAIQLVNVICLVVIYALLAKLTDFFWPESGLQNVVYVSLLFWPPLAFYVTYLYGILPGMALSLAAVWFAAQYLLKRRVCDIVFSCLCMGMATVLKMNCLIYLIAIACFLAYDVLDLLVLSKGSQRKKWALSLLFILCLAGSTIFCNQINNKMVERIAERELPEGIPMLAWVVMGLQEAPLGPGAYNGYISGVFTDAQYDPAMAQEGAKRDLQLILEHMAEDPLDKTLPFFARKTAFQWNDPTFICLDRTRGRKSAAPLPRFLESLIYGRGSVKLSVFLNDMQTFIWTGVLLWLLLRWNRGTLWELMGAVVFLGGWLFHLFWESGASYTLPYFVLLIPYAVCGFAEWELFLERRIAALRRREQTEGWVLRAALALAFALLLIAFTRTGLFERTVALNDDSQDVDAINQYYHRGVWEIKD